MRRILDPEKRGFGAYAAGFRTGAAGPPQHFLYFAPDLQGQGAFRGIFLVTGGVVGAGLQNEAAAGAAGAGALQNESRPGGWKRSASWVSATAIKASMLTGQMAA